MTGARGGPEDEMDAIEQLIPWYAAGALDPAETERVEAALAREPRLQASLRAAREEADETITLNESLGAPSGAAWARVLAATAAAPRRPSVWARLGAALPRFGSDRRTLALAGAAAAIVILLQGAALLALLPRIAGPGYSTVTQAPATGEGATAIVAFAPEATLQQVADLLRRHGAHLVDGPLAGGLFRVRIGEATLSAAEREAALAALRGEPLVRMALPAPAR